MGGISVLYTLVLIRLCFREAVPGTDAMLGTEGEAMLVEKQHGLVHHVGSMRTISTRMMMDKLAVDGIYFASKIEH